MKKQTIQTKPFNFDDYKNSLTDNQIEKIRIELNQSCMSVSSGTIANLSGFNSYAKFQEIFNNWNIYIMEIIPIDKLLLCDNWLICWHYFNNATL